jgi:hypothetical protein
MKSFGMFKLPMILVGLGAAIVLSPACKAQEVSPDHFTATGVQDVYEGASGKTVAPKPHEKPPATQTRTSQSNSSATLRPVAKRTPVAATQPKAVADKRKPVPATPKKQ